MNLNKNSSDMQTIVETFIVNETKELIYDNEKLDQWNGLVERLGLKGQTNICAKDKSPIPFLPMNRSLENVFRQLLPTKVLVSEFSQSPIPLEILDLVALSMKEEYFQGVEIWYDEKFKDPACIGYTGHWEQATWDGYENRNKEYDKVRFKSKAEAEEKCNANGGKTYIYFTETGKYLIGKWADVRRSMSQLYALARKRFVEEKSGEYKQAIRDNQRKLEDLDTEAAEKFGTESQFDVFK